MERPLQLLFLLLLCGACGSNSTTSDGPAAPPVLPPVIDAEDHSQALPTPPPIDYDTSQWAELSRLDSSLVLDLKYATDDNFVEEQLYDCPRCFLRPAVARALIRAQRQLRRRGLGFKLLDCYRPRPIQQKLWDKVPNASYVTPPAKGSMHNRGRAVDLTLVTLAGRELDMGTPFDFFGPRAHHTYTALPDSILERRRLLRTTMEAEGFRSIRTEWWHYSYPQGGAPLDDWLWTCDGNDSEMSISK
ncbi:MAG: M15 family metallopeptidase [Bacteroidota bacterium]